MTLPEGVRPSGPTEPDGSKTPDVEVTSASSEAADESSSDAVLRTWARDNGIDGVPASGKLSASWRDQITAAMAEAQAEDPKVEDSAEGTSSSELSDKVAPEFEPAEYRSVFKAPNTWVTSQTFTG